MARQESEPAREADKKGLNENTHIKLIYVNVTALNLELGLKGFITFSFNIFISCLASLEVVIYCLLFHATTASLLTKH